MIRPDLGYRTQSQSTTQDGKRLLTVPFFSSTPAAAATRSTIRRLREIAEV